MFAALRARFPKARLHVLVNSYNAPVLHNHPDVDEVHVYQKAKHRDDGQGLPRLYLNKLRILWQLRRTRFDYAILPGGGFMSRSLALARWIRPRHIVGYVTPGYPPRGIDVPVPYDGAVGLHEVEVAFRLLAPLGIQEPVPPTRVLPAARALESARIALRSAGIASRPIAIHISARKPSNRWPGAYFAEFAREIHRRHGLASMLFWSPGKETDPRHPGDDDKANEILRTLSDIPVVAYPTQNLDALVGGLSCCDMFVGGDGGAMHLAAGLGLPALAFFGKSCVQRWRPWAVPQMVLQRPSLEVADISVEEALIGFERLCQMRSVSSIAPTQPTSHI